MTRTTTTVYADYAATAPLRPTARAAMLDALAEGIGNPSSVHAAGTRARARLEAAREEVAAALGAHPLEIVFTSGATEANNLALMGVADGRRTPLHLAVAATEHSSILAPARALAARGHRLTALATDSDGRCEPAAVLAASADLLSMALVNAETGVIQDLGTSAAPIRARGGLVHTDAAQAAGCFALDVTARDVDLLTLSSAKVGGPPGAGALYVRRGVTLSPVLRGGPQEQGLRAGSENVPAMVGFAAALATAIAERGRESVRLAALSRELRHGIRALWPAARFAPADRAPVASHIVNVTLPGAHGEGLVAALDLEGVAVSTGSACAAGAAEPSHVLMAMGRSSEEAASALRISLGWASTFADVGTILAALARVLARVQSHDREAAWPAHGS